MSDHARRLREEYEQLALQIQARQAIDEYRAGLWALIDECRDRLGFPAPEAETEPEDEPTMH